MLCRISRIKHPQRIFTFSEALKALQNALGDLSIFILGLDIFSVLLRSSIEKKFSVKYIGYIIVPCVCCVCFVHHILINVYLKENYSVQNNCSKENQVFVSLNNTNIVVSLVQHNTVRKVLS